MLSIIGLAVCTYTYVRAKQEGENGIATIALVLAIFNAMFLLF